MTAIAAIYARKSTEQSGVADEQKSVTRQVEHARTYATRKGWIVADEHVYVDDGISGAEFANRPGFLRLMNALKPRPPFNVLIMSEESRLGREAIETAYALKQLVTAGVRVFFYLEDRERTLDSPTDKIMLSLTAFADELEREKARQRTYDAMLRKARAGHVTGGACFGYQNVDVAGPSGERSHVVRHVDEAQAVVVREIFARFAAGQGVRTIAKALNESGAVAPRPQQHRPTGWAPSSVWATLHRPVYRGEIVWNRSRKRNQWGAKAQTARVEQDWIRVPAPELRIVPEPLWQAVQTRAAATKAAYLKATNGSAFGRPPNGHESKYLLTGLTRCSVCGGSLVVRSRSHGRQRSFWYACSAFHHRGRAVCENSLEVRIERADHALLSDIEQFVLHPKVIRRAIEMAIQELTPASDQHEQERQRLDKERRQLEGQIDNLTRAIAAGGNLASLLAALQDAERRREQLQGDADAFATAEPFTTATAAEYEQRVLGKLSQWRAVLRDEPQEARTVLRQLVADRVDFVPTERNGTRLYRYRGRFTIGGLFEGVIEDQRGPQALASPTGTGRSWTQGLIITREGVIAA